jgi:ATP-dependent helicase/nuclease subunit A
VIIDEFQDTDPLQVEIASLLTADEPGRLVVVGDAKQSIYRFRRAEVALLRRLAARASDTPGHAVLHLTQNFRSRPSILRFVNRVFGTLIQASEESDQPPYEPIDPPADIGDVPSVVQLRFDAPDFAEGRSELLVAEAGALSAFARRAADGGFEVRDPGDGVSRPSRAGDLLILAPRLTQIRPLEEAFEEADLRFAVEGGRSFFGRQEVHEALSVLRAIDDRSDRVSLVAALRSSFFGVSDAAIASHVLGGGRLFLAEDAAVDGTPPLLAAAIALLFRLHRDRLRFSVPALVERLYDETGVLAALSVARRGEAQVANLEKVVALARQAAALGVLTLRGFTRLLEERSAGMSEEPDLPTTRPGDPDTVRILTIHKAKGLEAPIVALYDQAASLQVKADVIPLWGEGKVAVGFIEGFRPPDWNRLQERDRARAWAEGRRLLYVACTRARDLLVIPRPPASARGGSFWRDLWPFVDASPPSDVTTLDASTLPSTARADFRLDVGPLGAAEEGDAVAARWRAERRALVASAAERPLVPVPATRFAARSAPPPVVAASGRGGRDFGSLVHQVLEWIPLDAPERAVAMAEALAPRFGLDPAAARRAGEEAAAALATPLLARARRARRLWRELPLWFPQDGELVEGVVDLVFEEGDRLVVVDYKTDHIAAEQALAQAAHHAPQLQLYGRGLAQAMALPVAERLVLFTALGRVVPV